MNESQSLELDLGPELIRCRRLSGSETLNAQGFGSGWLLYYVFCPIMMLPVALLGATMPFFVVGFTMKEAAGPHVFVLSPVIYLVILYFIYLWPQRDYCILHEKGVRIRLGFKRWEGPFESLDALIIGRKPTPIEGGVRTFLEAFKPNEVSLMNEADKSALILTGTDGRTLIFKAFLTHFDPDDFQNLRFELVKRNPRLSDEAQRFAGKD